jgi:hypothetical protein
MKLKRWYALPAAGLAAVIVGVAAVEAAPSPSPSPSASTNYAQVFLEKLANILHLSTSQTQTDLKQAELQTVDQMVKDGKITQAQGDALKARINAGQGLGPVPGPGFGFRGFRNGNFGALRTLMSDLRTAEVNAAAKALGLSASDFQSALRSGTTLAQLETQHNVTDSAVQAAVKSATKGVLDKAVQAKTITQAQEDAILARIGTGSTFGHRHFPSGPFGPAGVPAAPVPPFTPAWYVPTI